MSYNTLSMTVNVLGHPHVMGWGSGTRSIKTTAHMALHIPTEINEIICDSVKGQRCYFTYTQSVCQQRSPGNTAQIQDVERRNDITLMKKLA